METVTVWYRWNKLADKFAFNHVSSGYDENQLTPTVNSEFQSLAWNNAKWQKYRGEINSGVLLESPP